MAFAVLRRVEKHRTAALTAVELGPRGPPGAHPSNMGSPHGMEASVTLPFMRMIRGCEQREVFRLCGAPYLEAMW